MASDLLRLNCAKYRTTTKLILISLKISLSLATKLATRHWTRSPMLNMYNELLQCKWRWPVLSQLIVFIEPNLWEPFTWTTNASSWPLEWLDLFMVFCFQVHELFFQPLLSFLIWLRVLFQPYTPQMDLSWGWFRNGENLSGFRIRAAFIHQEDFPYPVTFPEGAVREICEQCEGIEALTDFLYIPGKLFWAYIFGDAK